MFLAISLALGTPPPAELTLDELHHQPEVVWEADEARPTLAVTTTFAAPLILRLRAVLGGTVVDWTQETWVDAATSSGTPIAVPDALLTHPEADGMPITVFGVADTGYQSVGIPPWTGIVRQSPDGAEVEQAVWDGPIPWRAGLFPQRAEGRARTGRPASDDAEDTGLDGGAP